MTDKIIEAIDNKLLTAEVLTPEHLRKAYSNNKVYSDGRFPLQRGRGIFDDIDQLDQYLYTYGIMVNQQWDSAFETVILEDSTTLIDYGCGQGISLLNLICKWHPDEPNKTWQDLINSIVLIEPSKVALNRAEAIARLKFPEANIKTINKKLEDLDDGEISYEVNKVSPCVRIVVTPNNQVKGGNKEQRCPDTVKRENKLY